MERQIFHQKTKLLVDELLSSPLQRTQRKHGL